ncbi:MAG: dockerin type I domain-containing protein [Bacteroidota bacterium]
MKKYLIIPLLVFLSLGVYAQGLYNNGGKIIVGTGACVYISGNYQNETNGTNGSVNLSGTLKVEGNYINNVAASDIITTAGPNASVVFNGTTNQLIAGSTTATFVFPNLTINKVSNNITASKDIQVIDTLKFINGLVDITNSNLTFGLVSVVGGAPSATSMIVATGTGQVKKNWSALGSFTFPVGDFNVVGNYSPVTLNFTSGSFAPAAFVGINLANTRFNDPAIAGSYLNRYWNISQTGITGFTCNAQFQYLPTDVVGTENFISCLRVVPTPFTTFNSANTVLHQLSATALNSFGTFTGALGDNKVLSLKLYLEGLYNGGGLMRQAQGAAGNQYTGTTADDISIELHDPVTYLTPLYTSSNINLATDGNASVMVPGAFTGTYYITVKHRNSITTVSAAPVSFAAPTISYDFSTASTQVFGNNMKNMGGGVFAFYAGDVNSDGAVDGFDLISVENSANAFSTGYIPVDVNGDGVIDGFDLIMAENNVLNFVTTTHP